MQYITRPLAVDAFIIVSVQPSALGALLVLNNDDLVALSAEQCGGCFPEKGDYYVKQTDGLNYVLSKCTFEQNYQPLLGKQSWIMQEAQA